MNESEDEQYHEHVTELEREKSPALFVAIRLRL